MHSTNRGLDHNSCRAKCLTHHVSPCPSTTPPPVSERPVTLLANINGRYLPPPQCGVHIHAAILQRQRSLADGIIVHVHVAASGVGNTYR